MKEVNYMDVNAKIAISGVVGVIITLLFIIIMGTM